MSLLTNPLDFGPAASKYFVGRGSILERWRRRLTLGDSTCNESKGWVIIGPGGIGKTSLLDRMIEIAIVEFGAHTISLDLGRYLELDSPDDLIDMFQAHLPPSTRVGTRMRQWFGLAPNVSSVDLGSSILGLVVQIVSASLAPTGLGGLGVGVLATSLIRRRQC